MNAQHYISPESDRFMLPVSASVVVVLLLTALSVLTLYLSTELQFDLYGSARVLSALTAASLLVVAMLFWKLYLTALRRLGGRKDAKTTWLCVAVTAACIASTVVIALATSNMDSGQGDGSSWMAMCAILLSSLPTACLAAKAALFVAALFDVLRATEKARHI